MREPRYPLPRVFLLNDVMPSTPCGIHKDAGNPLSSPWRIPRREFYLVRVLTSEVSQARQQLMIVELVRGRLLGRIRQ